MQDALLQLEEIERFLVRYSEVKSEVTYARVVGNANKPIIDFTSKPARDARDEIAYQAEASEIQFSSIMEDAEAIDAYLASC